MLGRLFIQNFALIDRLELNLHPGFNVLTGETGAGKSIIIDAVAVLTGGQGLAEFIRSGEEKALIEGVFEIENNEKVTSHLNELGFLPEEGEALILTRELNRNGKNVCRINGRQVNLSLFKEVAGKLVDIYGQHHQQSLLDPQKHIELLDEFSGKKVADLKEKLALVYKEIIALQDKIKSMETHERDRARMLDMYKFQYEEIDKCRLQPDEDIALEEERNILAHAEKLAVLANSSYELLYEGGGRKSVIDLLHDLISTLKEAAGIDEFFAPICGTVESTLYQLEDIAREIKAYADRIEDDPARLEEVENRLNIIKQLKKKYGSTISEILEYKDQVAAAMAQINNLDEELAAANESLQKLIENYRRLAAELRAARKETALVLEDLVTKELRELNMPHVTFKVKIDYKEGFSINGTDDIEFLISPNKGEPLKPLAKIVSGGEMSRIMLAFKVILANIDFISTLIFDEVDAGIGGDALNAVAQKLSQIGRDRQVICVTHAPQIAGRGHHHYQISKRLKNGRTVTEVAELDHAGRVDEIARMLAGGNVTLTAKKHAEELIIAAGSRTD